MSQVLIMAGAAEIWAGEPDQGHYSKSVQETTYKMALNVRRAEAAPMGYGPNRGVVAR